MYMCASERERANAVVSFFIFFRPRCFRAAIWYKPLINTKTATAIVGARPKCKCTLLFGSWRKQRIWCVRVKNCARVYRLCKKLPCAAEVFFHSFVIGLIFVRKAAFRSISVCEMCL
jgi:hypothetical protein